jgi:hypothetical protein
VFVLRRDGLLPSPDADTFLNAYSDPSPAGGTPFNTWDEGRLPMSKGPGKAMNALEGALMTKSQTLEELAQTVNGINDPTRSQIESLRRAALSLEQLGRADVRREVRRTSGVWRKVLTVSTPLSDEERDQQREQERRQAEAVMAKVMTAAKEARRRPTTRP